MCSAYMDLGGTHDAILARVGVLQGNDGFLAAAPFPRVSFCDSRRFVVEIGVLPFHFYIVWAPC